MVKLIIHAGVTLAANAVGLIVAALALDDMALGVEGFVIAVLLFTLAMVLLRPLLTKLAIQHASALSGSTALVSTLGALIVTNLVSSSLHIRGFVTWVAATVIVWAASLLGAVLIPWLLARRAVKRARGAAPRSTVTTWR